MDEHDVPLAHDEVTLPHLLGGKPTRRQLLTGAALGTGSLLAGSRLLQVWSDDESDPGEDESDPRKGRAKNMRLVGYDPLQARSAYQPVIHRYSGDDGDRWVAFVGHHGGVSGTGAPGPNGTSIVDVTDPEHPRYLTHILGEPTTPGPGESGGAQMVRVMDGKDLPNADPTRVFMLRSFGNSGHQIYDVTDPVNPERLVESITGKLKDTHKSWWESGTGIAYLVSGDPAWKVRRMTKIYDLSDPTNPKFIRNFGLHGQQPGATVTPVPPDLHGPIPRGNRVYFAYGTNKNGVIQIVDRDKLLSGDPNDLKYPEIGRLEMPEFWGAHTTFPVLNMTVKEFAKDAFGRTRDFLVVTSESLANECKETRHLVFLVDITKEVKPFAVAAHQVAEAGGNFCSVGGRFGPHATNESFSDIYYKRIVFVSYFNAGVRAVDIRDPFRPKEVAHYIPAVTAHTAPRDGKIAIQTNNVELDDRGYIYIVDRANTGLHILKLTGKARSIANFPDNG
jgi:hypothetical protein